MSRRMRRQGTKERGMCGLCRDRGQKSHKTVASVDAMGPAASVSGQ